jgi:hypothetical protein
MRWYATSSNAKYIGQCDRLRGSGCEVDWQRMMESRERISMREFMDATDYGNIVDADLNPDMSPEDLLAEWISDDPDAGFYRSEWQGMPAYFVQHSGFELIFA